MYGRNTSLCTGDPFECRNMASCYKMKCLWTNGQHFYYNRDATTLGFFLVNTRKDLESSTENQSEALLSRVNFLFCWFIFFCFIEAHRSLFLNPYRLEAEVSFAIDNSLVLELLYEGNISSQLS
uniref:Uncharacterized protein n=1 Tax=Sphaerodactylus townsendi TaxID=933632 RepID=A0ACB8FCN3_9SAUR